MKNLLVLLLVLFAGLQFTYASSYKIDAMALDAKFSSAKEITIADLSMSDLTQNTKLKEDVSRSTAAVLGIFCGGLGIHRFYMGHKDAGIVYLVVGVFTGTSLSLIAGIIDGVLYVMATDEEFDAKYLHNEKVIQWL